MARAKARRDPAQTSFASEFDWRMAGDPCLGGLNALCDDLCPATKAAPVGLVSAAPIADNDAMTDRLPIDDAVPALMRALKTYGRAVLQAPPGAGKTTRVPLAMLDAGFGRGRIVMLEPRRLATRAAARADGGDAGRTGGPRPWAIGYAARHGCRKPRASRW